MLCACLSSGLLAQWHIGFDSPSYHCDIGDTLFVKIILSGNGPDIDSFGFDVDYPESILEYDACNFDGILENWTFKEANCHGDTSIRVGGFTLSEIITSPANVSLAALSLVAVSDGIHNIYVKNFQDDLKDTLIDSAIIKIILTNVDNEMTHYTTTEYKLAQNYPNPFNPTTTISYSLPKQAKVSIKVYNLIGEMVADLVNSTQKPGIYNIYWHASDMPAGTYFIKMVAGDFTQIQKCTLLK